MADHGPVRKRRDLEPLGWLGLLLFLIWTRIEFWGLLVGAGVLGPAWAVGMGRGRRRVVAVILLGCAVVVGLGTTVLDRGLDGDWAGYWDGRRAIVLERVGVEVDEVVARGDAMVDRLVRASNSQLLPDALQDTLDLVVGDAPLTTAVAIYDSGGVLAHWSGSHHGRFPRTVLDARSRYSYLGTPLFSYLYFVRALPLGRGTAVVALLTNAELSRVEPRGLGDFESYLSTVTGESVSIASATKAAHAGVFDYLGPDDPLIGIKVLEPEPSLRREAVMARGARIGLVLAGLAWLTLSLARLGPVRYPVAILVAAAAVLPLDTLAFPEHLRTLSGFQLAGPFPLPLGRVLLLAVAALPVAVLATTRWRPRAGTWVGPALVAVAFPVGIIWTIQSASLGLMGGEERPWIIMVTTVAIALATVVGVFLARGDTGRPKDPGRLLVLGLLTSAALGAAVATWARTGPEVSPLLAALWALPTLWVARGIQTADARSYVRWFAAFSLAVTCALPFMWAERTEARMEMAEDTIGRLGIPDDPDLDTRLERFAAHADSLNRAGVGGAELMYRSWLASDLALDGLPDVISVWSANGAVTHELRLGSQGPSPAEMRQLYLQLGRLGRIELLSFDEIGVHRLIAAPLQQGRLATVAVMPRRSVASPSLEAPLFVAAGEGWDDEFLTLVRMSGDIGPSGTHGVLWSRNDEGWHAEGVAPFPDGPYRVSYTISIPKASVMFARGMLVLLLSLASFSALWLISISILDLRLPDAGDWRALFASFRARVTWTLFGFFVLSNVVFGTLAYRALGGASERTASALAERAVNQVAEGYPEIAGRGDVRQGGAHLLEYRNGELTGGSVEELVDLGLYEGWVDPEIHSSLEGRERLWASKVVNLGPWRSVMSHRRLSDGGIVASAVPLRAGAAALRRRDVADMLALAIILGPVLAFALALLVGAALTRPISALQVASRRVGRGNLAVHLPGDRKDEFGAVFVTFNEMVRRLDAARRELLRTTRRTETIVAEAATGVIALDAEGRVTVANPRAEWMLSTSLAVGEEIPTGGSYPIALREWLAAYERSGEDTADANFTWRRRSIRARVRRIVQEGRIGGIVVSLQDVTDELERERILVRGDMAQRIAHEVKNPLTPIKLSVQHLQRVWMDRRGDFERVLERSVGVVLAEIDRLASIARSFSRMGSPGGLDGDPLVAVDVRVVIMELLDLYTSGRESTLSLEADIEEDLPLALCPHDGLKGVLINLLENARSAMQDGGLVKIGVRRTEQEPSHVAISVEDQGTGIPEELLARVFEPRFSTRSAGAGLGLWIAKRSVDSWGGSIEIASEVGRGTVVQVRLRCAASPRDDDGGSGAPDAASTGVVRRDAPA